MGLDVSVFEGPLELWTPPKDHDPDELYELADQAGAFQASCANGFDRLAPLVKDAFYVPNDGYSFRAGSYSGYNHYRDALSHMVLGVEASDVWGVKGERYADRPFYEQINFGDNEDTFGLEACDRLAEAYREHHQQALHTWGQEHIWFSVYVDFMTGFGLASATAGAVDYH